MPSLAKMTVVYLLIAPSLRNSRPAIAALESPSAIRARTAEQLGHHRRIERRATPRHPFECVDELLGVHDPVLELIADPAVAVGQQLSGVQLFHVLRKDQHRQAGNVPASGESGLQSLVGEGGGKAHVEDRHIRPQPDDRLERVRPRPDGGNDHVPVDLEQADEAVAEEEEVFG
jgi:hypothetical protein